MASGSGQGLEETFFRSAVSIFADHSFRPRSAKHWLIQGSMVLITWNQEMRFASVSSSCRDTCLDWLIEDSYICNGSLSAAGSVKVVVLHQYKRAPL